MYSPTYLTVESVHGLKETLIVGPSGLAIVNPSQQAEAPLEKKTGEIQHREAEHRETPRSEHPATM